MYQRIMVAVDGSNTSQRGLSEAINLAKDQHAVLAIVHVVDLVIARSGGQFLNVFVESTRSISQEVVEQARKTAHDAGIEPEIRTPEIVTGGYHVSETIAEFAREWHADLLVVGTHGRRGITKMLMGSVADGIVRLAPCPLLLIRCSPGSRGMASNISPSPLTHAA